MVEHPHVVVRDGVAYVRDKNVSIVEFWNAYNKLGSVGKLSARYAELSMAQILDALSFGYDNPEFTEEPVGDPVVHYFGCIGVVGHHLHGPNRQSLRGIPGLDGGYPPINTHEQGKATLARRGLHGASVTILAFWDRSVDGRGGSHSTFIIEGHHNFDNAVKYAKKAFPEVWARYTFPVVPRDVSPVDVEKP